MRDVTRLMALAARGEQIRANTSVPKPSNQKGFRFEAKGDRTRVDLYDFVGEWGVTARDFVAELAGIGNSPVDLHINSLGGDVFDGIAMHAALLNHPGDVTTYVDGVAASAASFIAMAGKEIVIEKPAKMMIHDASGLVLGNPADMREMADLLDEISDTIAGMYADRAGGDPSDWRASMRKETWYSAAQAVDAGLADRIANDSKKNDKPENRRTQLIRARARVALKGA